MGNPSHIKLIDAQNALQKYWNYPDFRSKQKVVIERVLAGDNSLALLPTGGGKSICYQVPAVLLDGLTLVISPLISLMEDQVKMLRGKGIKADYIHSGLTAGNIDRILDNTIYGDTRLLYVSPERLSHPLFLVRMAKATIQLVAVDEAHCISQWGHDFRPSYRLIHEFLEEIGGPQVLAVTATATPKVVNEICSQLTIKPSSIITDSFERSNIAISRLLSEDKVGEIVSLTQQIRGKTIIYARSRRNVEMIARTLRNHNQSAQHYHAGLAYGIKQKRQQQFGEGTIKVMVATNAFGMGIDVPDVRHVIHYDIPPSIEEYYQEIGRAGRDGRASYATLLVSDDNVRYSEERIAIDFQRFDLLSRVYKIIHVLHGIGINEGEGVTKPLDLEVVSHRAQLNQQVTYSCIKAWQLLGTLELSQDDRDRYYVKLLGDPRDIRQDELTLGAKYEVIASLMRKYEGIFDNWVELDVKQLSQGLKLEPKELINALGSLSQRGYLKLYESTSGQRVTYIKPRYPQANLTDFRPGYDRLKQRYVDRWSSMKGLINTEKCLSQYVLRYFGEESSTVCGQCTICRGDQQTKPDYLAQQRADNENR